MRAFLLPDMTPITAARWVRRGASWALLIGVLDLLIWVAVSRNDPESVFRGVQLIDALLTLLLAGGVWLRSRIAAGGLLAYWVYSKVHQLATTGRVVSPILGLLIFGWVFLNTLRAAIALHRGTPTTAGENAQAI